METLAVPVATTLGVGVGATVGVLQALMMTSVVVGVMTTEVYRRFAAEGISLPPLRPRACAKACGVTLWRNAPEAVGLGAVLMLALALRLRGDTEVFTDPFEAQVWARIKSEWPVLLGGDTLLGLQAMLRLLVLVSLTLRAGAEGPLSGMAAVFFLGAAMARVALVSQSHLYWLEGPLGGELPHLCEAAFVPLLAVLARRMLTSVKAVAMLSFATWWASHHYLNMARDASIDRLFTCAHFLEFLSALAFFASTVLCYSKPAVEKQGIMRGEDAAPKRACAGFLHLLMPVQAGLAAYYFLEAFVPNPRLVGAGRPFCILILGNLGQLAAYLGAAAFYLGAEFLSEPEQERADNVAESQRAEAEVSPEAIGGVDEITAITADPLTAELSSDCDAVENTRDNKLAVEQSKHQKRQVLRAFW